MLIQNIQKLAWAFTFFLQTSFAAGFIENVDGVPYVWKPGGSPITYRVDPGNVNGSISNAQAKTIIQQSFQVWSDAELSEGISFVEGADLATDIDENNYETFIRLAPDGSFQNLTDDTVIIFDEDAQIFEDLVGVGNASSILGIASPGKFDENNLKIEAGFAIINGVAADANQVQLQGTLTHEFGHLLNLAHTQLNTEEAFNDDAADDIVVPTMFPFLPDDPSVLLDLHRDDIFSMSILYPNSSAISGKSKIEGQILERNGDGVRGVNVICRSSSNPRVDAVSWISDAFLQDNGAYICGNLEAENHTVEMESLKLAVNVFSPNPPHIPAEFYNDVESFDGSLDVLTAQSLTATTTGTTVSDINLVINDNGRLQSGISENGKTVGRYAEYGYFIQVPNGADSLTVEVDFPNAGGADLDLHLRCDNSFSLTAGSTSPSITTQASVSSIGEGITETLLLEAKGSGESKLETCTYHMLVLNFDEDENGTVERDFKIKATVQGKIPNLTLRQSASGPQVKSNGEVWVGTLEFVSESDDFSWNGGRIIDKGMEGLEFINSVRVYKESQDNGVFDEGVDELVYETNSINLGEKSFSIESIDEFIERGSNQKFYIVYEFQDVPSSAHIPMLMLLAFMLAFLKAKHIKSKIIICFICLLPLEYACQSSGQSNFNPKFSEASLLNVTSLTFGENFGVTLRGAEVISVNDFFTP